MKRLFDIIASALGLVVLSPFILLIALAVKFTSPGPIVYLGTRVGLHGTDFKLYKFRTMVVDADKKGPMVTGARDTRITPTGRFLRNYKLDELPQLFNVLKGDMSFVGPRPEDPKYVEYYTDEQREVLNVRPGITSPATIEYRHEEEQLDVDDLETYYIENILPAKLAIDLEYARKASLREDISLILKTLKHLFK